MLWLMHLLMYMLALHTLEVPSYASQCRISLRKQEKNGVKDLQLSLFSGFQSHLCTLHKYNLTIGSMHAISFPGPNLAFIVCSMKVGEGLTLTLLYCKQRKTRFGPVNKASMHAKDHAYIYIYTTSTNFQHVITVNFSSV